MPRQLHGCFAWQPGKGSQRDGRRRRAHLAGVAAAVAADLGDAAAARWREGVAGSGTAPSDTDELGERFRELVRRADTVSGRV